MTKVGKLVTFRSGAELATKRCRKLNCTVPVGATQSPETFGGRSSSDCAASGTATVGSGERSRKLRSRVTCGPRVGARVRRTRRRPLASACGEVRDTIAPGALAGQLAGRIGPGPRLLGG